MPDLQPTGDQFRAFRDDPDDGPITQVNLLKFNRVARYSEGTPEADAGDSGAVAYGRYAEAFAAAAAEVGGRCILLGEVERYFIGEGDWDGVLVMYFPSRHAFIATLNHDGYEEMHRHRAAGLLCQELLTTRPSIVAADG